MKIYPGVAKKLLCILKDHAIINYTILTCQKRTKTIFDKGYIDKGFSNILFDKSDIKHQFKTCPCLRLL